MVPLAGAWRKRQRKCKHFLNQRLQGLGHNDNNKTPNLKEGRGFVVPLAGLVPLAETPRSDVINVVLCQRFAIVQAS